MTRLINDASGLLRDGEKIVGMRPDRLKDDDSRRDRREIGTVARAPRPAAGTTFQTAARLHAWKDPRVWNRTFGPKRT